MKSVFSTLFLLLISLIPAGSQQMIKDIWPGNGNSYPNGFKKFGDKALFVARDSLTGAELWITDGTAAGTILLKDIYVGPGDGYPTLLDSINGRYVFSAESQATGRELWATDGTPAGTLLLADINPGTGHGFYNTYFGKTQNLMFFTPYNSPYGNELYVTDGTPAGTYLVKDICVGAGNGVWGGRVVGGKLYFASYGSSCNARELWVSDGTSGGTQFIKSFSNMPYGFSETFGEIVFAVHSNPIGVELWTSDGTPAGTVLEEDIYVGSESSSPSHFMEIGGSVFFIANTAERGREWYYHYGNTYPSDEIVPGPASPLIETVYNSRDPYLTFNYFVANNYIHGKELYSITSYNREIKLLKDINPTGSSDPQHLTYINDLAFFTADDGVYGRELWVTDGSASGTRRLTDLWPGFHSSVVSNVVLLGDKIIFGGTNGTNGIELYSMDMSQVLSTEEAPADQVVLNSFPNPTTDQVTIELPEALSKEATLYLMNTLGQLVEMRTLPAHQGKYYSMNVSEIPAGIYYGKMITEELIYTFSVVVQH